MGATVLVVLAYVFGAASLFINSLLIYMASTVAVQGLGSYRLLLIMMSMQNMVYSALHMVVVPAFVLSRYCAILLSLSFEDHNAQPTSFLVALFYSCFMQQLVFLSFHFLHRYIHTCRSGQMQRFESWRGAMAFVTFDVIVLAITSYVVFGKLRGPIEYIDTNERPRHLILAKYGLDVINAGAESDIRIVRKLSLQRLLETGGTEILWEFVFAKTALVATMVTILLFMAFATARIYRTMGHAANEHRIHKEILNALVIQAVFPTIFCYIPQTMTFALPAFRTRSELLGDVVSYLLPFYPVVDPILPLFFISAYREQLYRFFGIREKVAPITRPNMMMSRRDSDDFN